MARGKKKSGKGEMIAEHFERNLGGKGKGKGRHKKRGGRSSGRH